MSTVFYNFAQFVTFCKSGIFIFAVFVRRIYYSTNIGAETQIGMPIFEVAEREFISRLSRL